MSENDALLPAAVAAHQAGRLDEAMAAYTRILKRDPRNFNALNLLGMVHHQQGRHERGEDLIRAAITLAPTVAGFHNNLGNALLAQRRLEQAEDAYREAIKMQPDYAEAHNNLGVVLLGQGKVVEAMAQLVYTINLKSDYPSARNNLGNVLRARCRYGEAVNCYRDALMLRPDYVQARANMAIALLAMGKSDEAIVESQRALEQRPDDLSSILTRCIALEQSGRIAEAIESYGAALRLQPKAVGLRFHLAALTGENTFDVPPRDFITQLFDNYADTFERHLTQTLKYRAPELLVEAMDAAGVRRDGQVVDLGCGTGLCGKLLRPKAKRLIGVDLSSHMVGQARERKLYDELFVDEIVAFLSVRFEQFDLAIAADVMIYFGDLQKVLAKVGQALKPGGVVAFSVEKYDGDGYMLNPTRRYAHSIGYIRSVAKSIGLIEVSVSECILRTEHRKDVLGWAVVLRRPG